MRLLIIEDEEDLASALKKGLQREGYAVDVALDGQEGEALFEINPYDLVILDLNLPGKGGFELLPGILQHSPKTRILILTARTGVEERIKGLNLGADDYLEKPFHFEEFLARVRALLRRNSSMEKPRLEYGPLTLDLVERTLYCDGLPIILTRKEFSLIEYMFHHQDEVISPEELMEHVWNEEANPFSNVIRVHITSLRKKIRAVRPDISVIENIPGVGYRLSRQLKETV